MPWPTWRPGISNAPRDIRREFLTGDMERSSSARSSPPRRLSCLPAARPGHKVIFYLGYKSGASGTYSLSGGSLSLGNTYLGYSGSGNITQSGGTSTIGYLSLGDRSGGSGTYNLIAGPLSAWSEYVGNSGAGSFTQSAGNNSIVTYLYLGYNSGSSGTYSLSGG